ncbi:MAG TPA: protein PilO [Desulfobacteraceae bacterium]|jgi:type IV pilus assembly protein PilO|nr:protein PilO [Desulfobacteraceae bacterium]
MQAILTPLLRKVDELSFRIRIIFFVLTIVVLGGVFIYFIYTPKSEEIDRLERRVGNLERQLFPAKSRAVNVKKLQAKMAEMESDFQEALKLLPNEREIPSLLRSITRMGSQSDLKFLLFKPENDVPRGFYVEIPVSIEVEGNFLDVAAFFDEVGGMERIVNIVNVSMRPEQDFSTTLKTTCTAVTYRFKKEDQTDEKGQGATNKK